MKHQKGFIQISLSTTIIISIVVASVITTVLVLDRQKKTTYAIADTSEVFEKIEDTTVLTGGTEEKEPKENLEGESEVSENDQVKSQPSPEKFSQSIPQSIIEPERKSESTLHIEISTSTVAWYGAIVATISVIANIILGMITLLRDRASIKIKISHCLLGYGPKLNEDLHIFIEASNKGRRPVTLISAGFKLENGHNIVFVKSRELPKELTEGKSYQEWVNKKEIEKDCQKLKTSIRYAWFKDATGRIYKKRYKLKDA